MRPVVTFLLALALGSWGATVAVSGVYKWTDDQGRVHYSDSPPAGAQAAQVKIRVNSIAGPAMVSTVRSAQAAVKDKVRIYTTSWCGYCKKAKAHLAARSVSFDEVDVESSERGHQEFTAIGGRGVPVVLVGDQRMDGFDPSTLDEMLRKAGY